MFKTLVKCIYVTIGLVMVAELAAAKAPYCTVKGEGQERQSTINANYRILPKAVLEKLKSVVEKMDKLNRETLSLKRKTGVSTYIAVEVIKGLPGFRTRTQALNTEVIELLANLPEAHRQDAIHLVEGYIQITNSLLALELFTNPDSVSLVQFRDQYALNITQATLYKIFPPGSAFAAGVETTEYTVEGTPYLRIHLSSDEIYRSMVRGAAQSPNSKNPYLNTVRCTLGRMMIGKFELQKALMSTPDDFSLGFGHSPLCLSSSTQEFIDISRADAESYFESFLRSKVAAELPVVQASKENIVALLMGGVFEQELFLYGFPESLDVMSENNGAPKPLTDEDLARINEEKTDQINQLKANHPELDQMMDLWEEPELQQVMNKIKDDCAVDANDKILFERMAKVENLYFSTQLAKDFMLIFPRLSRATPEENISLFKNFLLHESRIAVYVGLGLALDYYLASGLNPASEQILATVSVDISRIVTQLLNKRVKAAGLDDYIKKLAETSERVKASARDQYMESHITRLVESAEQVRAYMDPKITPDASLPYDSAAIIRALDPMLGQLSGGFIERISRLAQTSDFAKRKELWTVIVKTMEDRAQSQGTSCRNSTISNLGNLAYSFYDEHSASKISSAKRDCFVLGYLGGVLAINKKDEPQSMTASLEYLTDQYGGASKSSTGQYLKSFFKDNHVDGFFKNYRAQIAGNILAEYRILEMRSDLKDKKSPKIYEILAQIQNRNDMRLLVEKGIRHSLDNLKKNFTNVVSARTELDLTGAIKESSIINAILGQNSLGQLISGINAQSVFSAKVNDGHIADDIFASQFNFPTILAHHQKLQSRLQMKDQADTEVWDEFLMGQSFLTLGVLGGWVAKHAFAIFPRMTALPYVSWGFSRVGHKASSLIGGQMDFFMMAILGHAAYANASRPEYNASLENINDLFFTDAVKMPTPGSPVPLIEWNDYINQKLFFENNLKKAQNEWKTAAFWVALPVLTYKAFMTAVPVMEKIKRARNASLELKSVDQMGFREGLIRWRLNHRSKVMGRELQLMGIDESKVISSDTLSTGYQLAMSQAGNSARRRAMIEQAYERLILSYGSDIASIAQYPQLMEVYSHALMGKYGQSRDLHGILEKYNEIMYSKGVGALW